MKKIDATTYDTGNGYFVEKMADSTWTAYRPIDSDDRYLWSWSSPKHKTMVSARQAASMNKRLARHLGRLE